MRLKLNPRGIAIVLSFIAVLLALESVFSEYVRANILGMDADTAPARLLDLFSVNLESSLPTWYSTINLFLAACLLAWVALSKRFHKESYSAHWLGLSLVFFYLSIDEGAAVHETASGPLQSAFNTTGFLEFGWLIIGVPLVILFGIAFFRFWLHLPPRTRALFAVAGALYIGGAVLIESISANQYALDGGASFTYLAIATVEELCEMLGVIVLIYALLDYLSQRDEPLVVQAQTQPLAEDDLKLGWSYSLRHTAIVFAALLLVINGGLLLWGIALHDPDDADAAPYHYAVLIDELAGRDVTITHLPGVFSPTDDLARRAAAALQAGFPSVQILSLPTLNASIAVASESPVLTTDSIIELMELINETEYIFYDAAVVRAILTLP